MTALGVGVGLGIGGHRPAAGGPAPPAGFLFDFRPTAGFRFTDAAGLVAAAAGDPLGRVNDHGGGSLFLSQGTSGKRPTVATTSGGVPAMLFDGVGTYLANSSQVIHNSDAITIGVAVKTLGNSEGVWGYGDTGGGKACGLFAGSLRSGKWSVEYGGNRPYVTNAAAAANTTVIVTRPAGGRIADTVIYVNGVADGPSNTPSTVVPSDSAGSFPMTVGSWSDLNSNYFAGQLPGITGYGSVLDATGIAALHTYLASLLV